MLSPVPFVLHHTTRHTIDAIKVQTVITTKTTYALVEADVSNVNRAAKIEKKIETPDIPKFSHTDASAPFSISNNSYSATS